MAVLSAYLCKEPCRQPGDLIPQYLVLHASA